jgi:hypothetical protein
VGSYRYTSFCIITVSLRTIGQRVQVVKTVSQRQVGNCLRVDEKILEAVWIDLEKKFRKEAIHLQIEACPKMLPITCFSLF